MHYCPEPKNKIQIKIDVNRNIRIFKIYYSNVIIWGIGRRDWERRMEGRLWLGCKINK